jgi:hypothetical protein
MNEYLEIVSQLSLPTVEQTQAFTDYVVGAHSWYKHLPLLPPGAPFTFYLDPNAGRQISERWTRAEHPGGPFPEWFAETKPTTDSFELAVALMPAFDSLPMKTVIEDITDRRQCAHYSQVLTTQYRSKFGYWQYRCGSGPQIYSLQPVRPNPSSPNPLPAAVPVKVPEEIVRQCSCRVTAFIRGYAKYRCSLPQLRTFLNDFERYTERLRNGQYLEISRKLRQELEEANVFGLRPDAICDIDISSRRSSVRVWECISTPRNGIGLGRSVSREFDVLDFAREELVAQSDALLKALMNSRGVFSKLCQTKP